MHSQKNHGGILLALVDLAAAIHVSNIYIHCCREACKKEYAENAAGKKKSSTSKRVADVVYSCITKPPRKKLKTGMRPAPAPAPGNLLQIHTPPPTPGHSTPRYFPGAPPLTPAVCRMPPNVPIEQAFGEFLAFADASHPQSSPSPGQDSFPLPPVPDDDDDIEWRVHTDESTSVVPDNVANIKEKAKRYYPILVGLHAPSTELILKCNTKGCNRDVDCYYSCSGCRRERWYCDFCMVARHEELPFHRIRKWDTVQGCMTADSLAELGLVMQMDHADGTPCDDSTIGSEILPLSVFAIDGVHEVRYRTCPCGEHKRLPEQLLANRLFPATDVSPQRVFTFDILRHYDIMDLSCHLSIKQFCDGVLELTPGGEGGDVSQ